MTQISPYTGYLDSSDYSRLSQGELSDDLKRALEVIQVSAESGRAIFPVSAVHISECINSEIQYKDAALGRAALMEKFSRGVQLIYPTSIIELEVDALLGDRAPVKFEDIISPKGTWLGIQLNVNQKELRSEIIRDILNEANSASLPRAQRQALKTKIKHFRSTFRSEIYELLKHSRPDFSKMPYFALVDRDIIYKWFINEVSDQEFTNELLRIVQNVPAFYEACSHMEGRSFEFFNIFRHRGDAIIGTFKDNINLLSEKYAECVELSKKIGAPMPGPQSMMTRDRKLRLLYSMDSRLEAVGEQGVPNALKKCPSLGITFNTMYNYMIRALQAAKSGNQAHVKGAIGKTSFFSDWLHIAYLPYLNLFRCDKDTGALVRQSLPSHNNVFTNFPLMVGVVETWLSGDGCSGKTRA